MKDTLTKDKKFCECGCGQQIPIINSMGKPAKFKLGHNNRGLKFTQKINIEIECACGCGQRILKYDSGWRERRFKNEHRKFFYRRKYCKKHLLVIYHEGYRFIYRPGHIRANNKGYVREHLLVMEAIIGRPVRLDEDVHHINGDRKDNRPANLQLLVHGKHSAITNTKDMTDRICCECGSSKTVGRSWYKTDVVDKLRCHKCRNRYLYRNKKQLDPSKWHVFIPIVNPKVRT